MPDAPLVSVIIPTFNRAAILAQTLRDTARQTWRPLELVVVNDGSRDDTDSVLARIRPDMEAAGVIPRFLHQANAGVAAARNLGLREAAGDYIAFLDDDDRWEPAKLEKQLAALLAAGADACTSLINNRGGTATVPRNAEQLPQGRCPAALLDRRRSFSIISLVVRAEVARKAGEFDTSLRTAEDTEWMMRLAHHANFTAVPEVLATYIETPGSLSDGNSLERLVKQDEGPRRALALIRERCSVLPGWDEKAWRNRVAQDYDQFVKHLLYSGELNAARETFEEGMRLSHGAAPLPRVKSKLRKARWLALFGRRLKHPKLC
jgi:glycosyltransferase involved in cell wall biosynthesis